MYTVGVSAVVRNTAGQVLLVRTEKAGWELPGGRVEADEDLLHALQREVREEAGCELETIGAIAGVYCAVRARTLMLVVRATSTTQQPESRASDEDVLEAAWFTADEALRQVTHPSEHDRLTDGLADEPQAIYRSYL